MIDFVRQAAWLDRDRVLSYARFIAILYVPALVFLLLVTTDTIAFDKDATGTDFVSFWTAARLALQSGPASVYDFAAFSAAQTGSVYAFLYPPPFLAILLPLGGLPYGAAFLIWVALGIAAFVVAARRLSPSIWPVLAYPPLLINAAHGQNGSLTATLFCGAALAVKRRPFIAGLLLGGFIIKPHLALLFPVAVLAGRKWAMLAGGALSAMVLAGVTTLLFGLDPWWLFFENGAFAADLLNDNHLLLPKMVSAFGLVRAPGAPLWAAYGLQAALLLAAAVIVGRVWAKEDDSMFAMAVLATGAVLATPFIYSYDLVLLIVPLAWLAKDGMEHGFVPWTKAIMTAAYFIALFDRSFALAAGFNPAVIVNGLLMLALLRQKRGHDARSAAFDLPQGL